MKQKFHINDSGNPGPCRARKSCPFGDLEKDHYESLGAARHAYEKKIGASFLNSANVMSGVTAELDYRRIASVQRHQWGPIIEAIQAEGSKTHARWNATKVALFHALKDANGDATNPNVIDAQQHFDNASKDKRKIKNQVRLAAEAMKLSGRRFIGAVELPRGYAAVDATSDASGTLVSLSTNHDDIRGEVELPLKTVRIAAPVKLHIDEDYDVHVTADETMVADLSKDVTIIP